MRIAQNLKLQWKLLSIGSAKLWRTVERPTSYLQPGISSEISMGGLRYGHGRHSHAMRRLMYSNSMKTDIGRIIHFRRQSIGGAQEVAHQRVIIHELLWAEKGVIARI